MKDEISPTPWQVHAHGDIAVDILDGEGAIIAKMWGKPGCAFHSNGKPGLHGIIFGNAKLIVKLVNQYIKKPFKTEFLSAFADTINFRKFGGLWNKTVYNFEVSWNIAQFVISRPFSSKDMTLNRADARNLRNALNQFLGDT